jgi:hypothetical protein
LNGKLHQVQGNDHPALIGMLALVLVMIFMSPKAWAAFA